MDSEQTFKKELLPHKNALFGFAYSLCLNDAIAKDLVQDTFYKAITNISKYKKNTKAKAWLFNILKNTFINQYRKQKKRPKQVDYEEFMVYQNQNTLFNDTSFTDLRVRLIQNTVGDEILNALNELNIKHRTILLLSDLEEFSYEEISKILNIPIGTVRSRLHRARNKMKRLLSNYANKMGFSSIK
jgi:RNA polymerase sigma-70 factor (ECF subfamily)